MRQGQQNRRGRGRGNNGSNNNSTSTSNHGNQNRSRGQSPLSRNFESNGPDVKIRGNAAHIAEKYMSLARDAQSSGDNVKSENYLQHAEHYNRIIMAAQTQAGESSSSSAGQRPRPQQQAFGPGDEMDESDNDEQGQPSPSQQRAPQQTRYPRDDYAARPERNQDRNSDRGGDRGADRDTRETGRDNGQPRHYRTPQQSPDFAQQPQPHTPHGDAQPETAGNVRTDENRAGDGRGGEMNGGRAPRYQSERGNDGEGNFRRERGGERAPDRLQQPEEGVRPPPRRRASQPRHNANANPQPQTHRNDGDRPLDSQPALGEAKISEEPAAPVPVRRDDTEDTPPVV